MSITNITMLSNLRAVIHRVFGDMLVSNRNWIIDIIICLGIEQQDQAIPLAIKGRIFPDVPHIIHSNQILSKVNNSDISQKSRGLYLVKSLETGPKRRMKISPSQVDRNVEVNFSRRERTLFFTAYMAFNILGTKGGVLTLS